MMEAKGFGTPVIIKQLTLHWYLPWPLSSALRLTAINDQEPLQILSFDGNLNKMLSESLQMLL